MLDKFRETAITWDKATSRIYSPVTANESDEKGRKLVVKIVNSGQVEDLTGATLHLYWETRDKAHDGLDVFKAVDLKKGEFELSYTTGMLSNKGVLNANLVLIDTVGRVVSERFKITVTEGIDNDAIQSENSFSSLTQALIDISNLEQNYAPRLNNLTAQLQQTEYEATRKRKLEDLDSEVLSAIEGGEGTSFSLLSVPQPKSVTWDKTTFIVTGKNKHNPLLDTNGTLGSSGQVVASDTNSIVDYIPIQEGDSVYLSYGGLQTQFNNRIVVYDKQKNVLEVLSGYVSGTAITTSGASYVRTAVRKDILSDLFMISLNGLYPYEDYIEYFNNVKISKDDVIGLNEVIETSGSRLEGQNMVSFGDSITGNALVDDYPSIVAKRTGMTVYNVGFGGTRAGTHHNENYDRYCFYNLCDYIVSGDYSPLHAEFTEEIPSQYATRIATLESIDFNKVKIITVAYGANDWGANTPEEGADDYDVNSFRGALRRGIKTLLEAYPHLQILVISPFYRFFPLEDPVTDSDEVTRGLGGNAWYLSEYVEAAESIAKEFHVPFYDAYNNLGINRFTRWEYFSGTDGTHHDVRGRELVGNKLSNILLSNF